jgi:hypothetical protein
MRPKGTIIGLLGIWIIVAAIWRFNPLGEVWSDIFTGVIVGILGFSLAPSMAAYRWITGIAGCWLIAAAFIPELHAGTGILANNIITGLLLMVVGFTLPAPLLKDERKIDRAA